MELDVYGSKKEELIALTSEEILHFFSQIRNRKQRLLLILHYATGMALEEILQLRAGALCSAYGFAWVQGRRGEVLYLSPKLHIALEEWVFLQQLHQDDFLFPLRQSELRDFFSFERHLALLRRRAGFSEDLVEDSFREAARKYLLEQGYCCL